MRKFCFFFIITLNNVVTVILHSHLKNDLPLEKKKNIFYNLKQDHTLIEQTDYIISCNGIVSAPIQMFQFL